MFGKMALTIEKSALIGALGLVIAACALVLLQRAITCMVLGSGSYAGKHARSKGSVLLAICLPMLFSGVYIILKSDKIVGLLMRFIELIATVLPIIQV